MKKANFKKALMALLMAAFTFLFVGVGTTNAQLATVGGGLYSPAQGNFVNNDQAGITLLASIDDLGTLLESLQPGTPAYTSTRRQALYYKGIYQDLLSSNNVAASIGTGLQHLTIVADGSIGPISKTALLALRQGAISLLSI
ncbi:MAG: hypothetical protein EPO28_04230 [Saprospiraceae bacterium]|nr:MAG: hypothetical protein EPO28_04230 [Saprospiraceae bacterium]